MIKQILYSIIKGITPLLFYYLILKVSASKGGLMFDQTYKEILGMSVYYSFGLIFIDIVIQILIYLLILKKNYLEKTSILFQGMIFNVPLCLMFVLLFSEMENPDWRVVMMSCALSILFAGLVFVWLTKIAQTLKHNLNYRAPSEND